MVIFEKGSWNLKGFTLSRYQIRHQWRTARQSYKESLQQLIYLSCFPEPLRLLFSFAFWTLPELNHFHVCIYGLCGILCPLLESVAAFTLHHLIVIVKQRAQTKLNCIVQKNVIIFTRLPTICKGMNNFRIFHIMADFFSYLISPQLIRL